MAIQAAGEDVRGEGTVCKHTHGWLLARLLACLGPTAYNRLTHRALGQPIIGQAHIFILLSDSDDLITGIIILFY